MFNCHCFDEDSFLQPQVEAVGTEIKRERGGQEKPPALVKDLESTGRKQADKLYPIDKGMICEWAGLKNAGGGVEPIIGCLNNPAVHRHHGPDKTTLNNRMGNVHRICAFCHVRWHTANDKFYPSERPRGDQHYLPAVPYICLEHDRDTKATPKEILDSHVMWTQRKKEKVYTIE
jgi:hypothetical protein